MTLKLVVKKLKIRNCIVSIYTIARESVRDSNCIVGAIVPRDSESLSALSRAVQRGAPTGALGVTKRSLVTETTLLANRAKKPQEIFPMGKSHPSRSQGFSRRHQWEIDSGF